MQWHRLRGRLSLRTLMFLVLVVGCGFEWIIHRVSVQRDAVAAIKHAGGSVQYDSDWSTATLPSGSARKRLAWKPKWLVDRTGADFFQNVVSVFFTRGASNSELVHVVSLRSLETLVVPSPSLVTDAGLVDLKGLTELSNLNIPGSKVSGEGLAHLKGMTKLRMLILWNTQVGDAGLVHLKGMTKLRTLDLSNTRVTDAGLIHLKGMNNLDGLGLSGTRVSDAGLVHLKGMTRLRVLLLDKTQVSDVGVTELRRVLPKTEITRK
jgi:hypothetical protein